MASGDLFTDCEVLICECKLISSIQLSGHCQPVETARTSGHVVLERRGLITAELVGREGDRAAPGNLQCARSLGIRGHHSSTPTRCRLKEQQAAD
jgi:hypothetical protein